MLIFTWLFDKLGYMPKISINTSFPCSPKEFYEQELKKPIKKVAKKTPSKPVKKKP